VVERGGAADRAGLRPGDVILAFNGIAIDRGSHLQWIASTTGVGVTVKIRVARKGEVFEQDITLGELREQTLPRQRPLSRDLEEP
jgi:serine protease Do